MFFSLHHLQLYKTQTNMQILEFLDIIPLTAIFLNLFFLKMLKKFKLLNIVYVMGFLLLTINCQPAA